MTTFHIVLIVNGIYDLVCASSILFTSIPIISSLHPGIFAQDELRTHPVIRRLLAYWILTFGSVRLAVLFRRCFDLFCRGRLLHMRALGGRNDNPIQSRVCVSDVNSTGHICYNQLNTIHNSQHSFIIKRSLVCERLHITYNLM